MDNPEPQVTLGTRHRTMKNKTKTKHKTLQRWPTRTP